MSSISSSPLILHRGDDVLPCRDILKKRPPRFEKAPPSKKIKVDRGCLTDYLQQLDAWGIGLPLRNPSGTVCRGVFSTVFETIHPDEVIKVSEVASSDNPTTMAKVAEQSIEILRKVQDCPHVPRLFNIARCQGYLYATKEERLPENLKEAYINPKNPFRSDLDLNQMELIAKKLLEALAALHEKQILHGDIKPDNCSKEGHLFDFNGSEILTSIHEGILYTSLYPIYTSYYRPPETVITKTAQLASDLWALGCTLFEAMTQKILIPVIDYTEPDKQDLADRMRLALYYQRLGLPVEKNEFPPFLEELSHLKGPKAKAFKDLLQKMLMIHPNDRISAKEALHHPFFSGATSTDCAFELKVQGLHKPVLQIRDPKGDILKTIDLAREVSSTLCCHVPRQTSPYRFELVASSEFPEPIASVDIAMGNNRPTLLLDTDKSSFHVPMDTQ